MLFSLVALSEFSSFWFFSGHAYKSFNYLTNTPQLTHLNECWGLQSSHPVELGTHSHNTTFALNSLEIAFRNTIFGRTSLVANLHSQRTFVIFGISHKVLL